MENGAQTEDEWSLVSKEGQTSIAMIMGGIVMMYPPENERDNGKSPIFIGDSTVMLVLGGVVFYSFNSYISSPLSSI